MSRYRSEVHSLRARILDMEEQLRKLDLDEGVGVYASTNFGQGMYWLGLRVGAAVRAALRRVRGQGPGTDVEQLRARVRQLEGALADRQAARRRGS
jgi:hypothetical protein